MIILLFEFLTIGRLLLTLICALSRLKNWLMQYMIPDPLIIVE